MLLFSRLSDEMQEASIYIFIHSRPAFLRSSEKPKRRVNYRTQNESACRSDVLDPLREKHTGVCSWGHLMCILFLDGT